MVDLKELSKYQSTISIERLMSFVLPEENPQNITLDVLITRYKDNVLISQAFYPVLSVLEITLRNSIDTMLKIKFGENWIENELSCQNILCDYDYNSIKEAYEKTKQAYNDEYFTYGKVIANLSFGFWVNLCSKKYNVPIWTKQGCFRGVFVDYPTNKQEQIHEISKKLVSIKKLRNKIFHYEPILKHKDKILNKYDEMLEILSYLPTDNSDILNKTCNFKDVYNVIVQNEHQKT
jgi:hypothetical protein